MTQIQTKTMTRKQRRNAPRRKSPPNTPELRGQILDLLRQGVTITEMSYRDDMPPIASIFEMRRKDAEFAAAFTTAMHDHAETLISDAMDQNIAAVDNDHDTAAQYDLDGEPVNPTHKFDPARAKAADQYLQAALKYAGAIAPAKYGALVKMADAQIGSGIQISITSYANDGSADGRAGAQDTSQA